MPTLIIGIGGAGCAIAARLQVARNIPATVLNTDVQALENCPISERLLLGSKLCGGRPVSTPKRSQGAIEESRSQLASLLKQSQRLILIAGLGGGAGTGEIPVLARIATERETAEEAITEKAASFLRSQK